MQLQDKVFFNYNNGTSYESHKTEIIKSPHYLRCIDQQIIRKELVFQLLKTSCKELYEENINPRWRLQSTGLD